MTSQILVKGSRIDDQTHCIHYQSELDIIAIKLKCCQTYYPCIRCHQAEADHAVQRWAIQELHLNALLCGACKIELTVRQYLDSNYSCPNCGSAFNPACSTHNDLYFEL